MISLFFIDRRRVRSEIILSKHNGNAVFRKEERSFVIEDDLLFFDVLVKQIVMFLDVAVKIVSRFVGFRFCIEHIIECDPFFCGQVVIKGLNGCQPVCAACVTVVFRLNAELAVLIILHLEICLVFRFIALFFTVFFVFYIFFVRVFNIAFEVLIDFLSHFLHEKKRHG